MRVFFFALTLWLSTIGVAYRCISTFHDGLLALRPQIQAEAYQSAGELQKLPDEKIPTSLARRPSSNIRVVISDPTPRPSSVAFVKLEGQSVLCASTHFVLDPDDKSCSYEAGCVRCTPPAVVMVGAADSKALGCSDGTSLHTENITCCAKKTSDGALECPLIAECFKVNEPSGICF